MVILTFLMLCDIASEICHLAQAIKGEEKSATEEVKHILEMVFTFNKYIIQSQEPCSSIDTS